MTKKWSKERARFIGRIIFADFLEFSLKKYKDFIESVEQSPLFDKHGLARIKIHRLARITSEYLRSKYSSQVIAKILKRGKGFTIRYVYEGFNKIYIIRGNSIKIRANSCYYKLRRINSRNKLTYKILKGIIEHQKRYLRTSDPIELVPLSQVQLAIDNSWISRLVARLSVITPSGEEKLLKWFFQTQKDVNKRLMKRLLDKENEDIEPGRQKKPLTDNQIRAKLESEYEVKLSRHSIAHCRKDMGIPPAKRRLSGYKYPPLSANFSMLYPLTVESVQSDAPASSGIYEFRLRGKEIEYSNSKTSVIYIGSAKNLKKRLKEHLRTNNKNGRIRDFLRKFDCSFRYIQFLKNWKKEEGRLYNLFVATYSTPPKCNKVTPYCINS